MKIPGIFPPSPGQTEQIRNFAMEQRAGAPRPSGIRKEGNSPLRSDFLPGFQPQGDTQPGEKSGKKVTGTRQLLNKEQSRLVRTNPEREAESLEQEK